MPGDKIFVDTNIIIYAYDTSAGKKHEIAGRIMLDLWDSGLGVISTQVLQEFFVSVTSKIPIPLDIKKAKEIIRDFLKWEVIINDGARILSAIEIQAMYKYSFWDSMILESAISSGSSLLLSEDFSDGQLVHNVTIKNPFKASR
ncbi:MAG: PIN domain-containing protein [bacterium]